MSDHGGSHPAGERPGLRRTVVVLAALLGVVAIIFGGSSVQPQLVASTPALATPLVGRTSSICTVLPPAKDRPADQPAAATSVTAVGIPQDPERPGRLSGTPLDSEKQSLLVSESGKGSQLGAVEASVLLQGEGGMATAATGAVLSAATSGPDAGLSAAPCLAPGTQHWFTGLGTDDADRAVLVLTNPDDAQAEVDLQYFGRRGRVAVAGSPGVVIEAHTSRTVSLSSALLAGEGPFGLQVQASAGRVSAVVHRTRTSSDLKPSGVDWQLPAAGPGASNLIPGVPGGAGGRELVVTNPGAQRATVAVQVLGLQGSFAPSGAASVDVPPESTASVDLAPGLGGEAGAVELSSDEPVTGSVVSTSRRTGASADLAVQSAAGPLAGTGASAVATTSTAESELVLSNGGDTDAQVSFAVLSLTGVTLRTDEVLLAADSTATRRLTSAPPAYVVVRVPAGSAVVAGVTLTQPDGDAAGISTIPLTSPDLASRAPGTVSDPSVGR